MTEALNVVAESVWLDLSEPGSLSLRRVDPWQGWTRIVHQGGICGGRARVKGTRIPVWVLAQYWEFGATDETIMAAFSSVTKEDLQEARSYIEANAEEIRQDILDQDDD